MALLFQNEDEVDRQLKKERMSFRGEILVFLFSAGLFGLVDWIFRGTLKRYEETLVVLIVSQLLIGSYRRSTMNSNTARKEINGRFPK